MPCSLNCCKNCVKNEPDPPEAKTTPSGQPIHSVLPACHVRMMSGEQAPWLSGMPPQVAPVLTMAHRPAH